MDRLRSAAAARVFEDFDPAVEWKLAGEEQDVVEITLPGFRKDQVRVQVDNHGVLRSTGERPTRGGRWARFKKDLRLPDNCDADGVRARFEAEKLIITLPIVAATPTPSPTSHSPPPSPAPQPTWPPAYSEPTRPPPPPPPPPPPRPPPPVPSHHYEPPPPLVPTFPEPPPAPRPPPPSAPPPRPSIYSEAAPSPEQARRLVYSEPTPPAPPGAPTAKPATEEPKPSTSRHGTPAAPEPKPSTPPLWQTPVSASPPPATLPPRGAEEPQKKKKQLQDTSSMGREEDGKVSGPAPPPPEKNKRERTKRARGKLDEAGRGGSEMPSEKKNRAQELPAVGDAPTTTGTMTPEPARQLLVNAAAAVAVLVGVIVAAWRTLQS